MSEARLRHDEALRIFELGCDAEPDDENPISADEPLRHLAFELGLMLSLLSADGWVDPGVAKKLARQLGKIRRDDANGYHPEAWPDGVVPPGCRPIQPYPIATVAHRADSRLLDLAKLAEKQFSRKSETMPSLPAPKPPPEPSRPV